MIPLAIADVVINDGCKCFGFWRKALIGSLFQLEQQAAGEIDSGLLVRGRQRLVMYLGDPAKRSRA
jgi:hypothetical protein